MMGWNICGRTWRFSVVAVSAHASFPSHSGKDPAHCTFKALTNVTVLPRDLLFEKRKLESQKKPPGAFTSFRRQNGPDAVPRLRWRSRCDRVCMCVCVCVCWQPQRIKLIHTPSWRLWKCETQTPASLPGSRGTRLDAVARATGSPSFLELASCLLDRVRRGRKEVRDGRKAGKVREKATPLLAEIVSVTFEVRQHSNWAAKNRDDTHTHTTLPCER